MRGISTAGWSITLHAEGQRFRSVILHIHARKRIFDMLDIKKETSGAELKICAARASGAGGEKEKQGQTVDALALGGRRDVISCSSGRKGR